MEAQQSLCVQCMLLLYSSHTSVVYYRIGIIQFNNYYYSVIKVTIRAQSNRK